MVSPNYDPLMREGSRVGPVKGHHNRVLSHKDNSFEYWDLGPDKSVMLPHIPNSKGVRVSAYDMSPRSQQVFN